MTNKKTPTQEAIEYVRKLSEDSAKTEQEKMLLSEVIKTLKENLPKEKEFAREMFNEGFDSVVCVIEDDESNSVSVETENVSDFESYFKQYEP